MKYRKLTPTGDYTLGQGSNNFYNGIDAVRQAIQTRLTLLKATFWRDVNDGLPLFQNILGAPGSAASRKAIDTILQSRIRGTTGVTDIISYSSQFDSSTRQYSFQAVVQTLYSATTVSGTL